MPPIQQLFIRHGAVVGPLALLSLVVLHEAYDCCDVPMGFEAAGLEVFLHCSCPRFQKAISAAA